MNRINIPDRILLVSSRSDPAGSLIHEEVRRLLRERPDLEGRFQHQQYEERLIYIDGPSLSTDADCIIFLSRHASKEPRPLLAVHVTGNFGAADYGGSPGTITDAATGMMHAIMNYIASDLPAGYSISYEATHHGPTKVPVPSCFVELGSTESEWHDRYAASVVARGIICARPGDVIPLAGFGGTHYAKRQTEISLTTRGGFGHIMPTRDLVFLDNELFTRIVRGSGAEAIYIDRKSVQKDDIRRIEGYADALDLPVLGQSDLMGLNTLPFDEYKKIRRVAEEILPGSLVHIHHLQHGLDVQTISISTPLIEEIMKIGPDIFLHGINLLPIAHLSGGGVACHPVFITNTSDKTEIQRAIIQLCITILEDFYKDRIRISESVIQYIKGSSVEGMTEGTIEIRERRFDPIKARDWGVLPGRDFGRLAAGETLLIGGEKVMPDQVLKEYIREIKISLPCSQTLNDMCLR